jgi:hypothetical protein
MSKKLNLGLFGDSFGYQQNNPPYPSWVDLLEQHYNVKNYCRCGISEYKILQHLKQADLDQFDQIIITHTSPTRVYVPYNPLHAGDPVYNSCDIIYSDSTAQPGEFSQACKLYFKHIFDTEYAIDIHNMICREIDAFCCGQNVLHITQFDYEKCYKFPELLNFYHYWIDHKGPVNHYDQKGNEHVYHQIINKLGILK